MTRHKTTLFTTTAAALAIVTGSAHSAIVVPGDAAHVVGGSNTVIGTLIAIDVPVLDTSTVYNSTTNIGGPAWVTGGGVIAHQADQGFLLHTRAGDDYTTRSGFVWEPDGTPLAEARSYGAYNSTNPEVQFLFNLADSGIALPDGSVINAIYTTWKQRGDTADYRFTEGAQSDTDSFNYGTAPENDLTLRWYDDTGTGHDAEFQQLFDSAGDAFAPITVGGGDGFVLQQFRQPNTAHIEAIILDVTLVPEPSSMALLGLGGLLIARRRRRG